jgi:hypothetical protein
MRDLLALLLWALVAPAFAQTVIQQHVSGNEVWSAGQGPGGPSNYLNINTVRNGTAFAIQSGTGAATANALGGTLMWISTAPTSWTVTFPNATFAFDGEIITLDTDTTLTTMVTVAAGTGNTLHAAYTSQTLTALTPVVFQYHAANATWYRTR